jgi:hypothetical protein
MKHLPLTFSLAAFAVFASIGAAQQSQPSPQNQAASASTPAKPVRVHAKLDGFDITPNKQPPTQAGGAPAAAPRPSGPKTQIGGASRGLGAITLYAPADGKAYSLHPVFHWSAGGNGTRVKFVLMDPAGGTIYENTVDSNSLTYPADAPALQAGMTYSWNVIPEVDMLSGSPQAARITIVGGPERSVITADVGDAGNSLAQARTYVDHRIWYDAIESYSAAIAAAPTSKVAYQERGTIYDQFPQTHALAERDFSVADKM